ncbi:MAG: hypothetical protein Q8L27_01890 [archaeon]|nr:hypothetical protein [archaeon]
MDNLEAFAIGWSANSLLAQLKEGREKEGKTFVPYVVRVFELSDFIGVFSSHFHKELIEIGLVEKEKVDNYKSSLRKIFERQDLDDDSRRELVSFLQAVSDYCILESRKYLRF